MFDRRSDEEKAAAQAAERAEAAAAKAAAEAAAQARAAEKEAARFATTPLGQAMAAKERGDGFLQVQIPISTLEGQSNFGETTNRFTNHGPRGGLLTEIEGLGWRLEHAGYVFIETATVSTNRLVFTGEGTAQRGLLVGIYLFRDVPPVLPIEAPPGDVPPDSNDQSGSYTV